MNKHKNPEYPFLLTYGDNLYAAVGQDANGRMTLVYLSEAINTGRDTTDIFRENVRYESFLLDCETGYAKVVCSPNTVSVDVAVDTADIEKATQAAEHLEAALKRVKEMLK